MAVQKKPNTTRLIRQKAHAKCPQVEETHGNPHWKLRRRFVPMHTLKASVAYIYRQQTRNLRHGKYTP
jgi:hypothetical protein